MPESLVPPRTRAEAASARAGSPATDALDRTAKRLGWMDAVRGLAIVLVILHHSTQGVEHSVDDLPAVFDFLSEFFAPFRMPMLMFLSGLLVAGSLKRPPGEYAWGKVRRIGWPIVVWTFVYAAAEFVGSGEFDAMPWQPEFWNSYLWFMQFVLAYYLIALLTRWIPVWVLVLLPFAGVFLLPAETLGQRFLYLMPFFFLGAFLEQHWRRFVTLLTTPMAIALAAVPLAMALFSALYLPLWYQPLAALPALFGIAVLARLAVHIPDVRWLGPLRFVGRYSLIFYCVHYPVYATLSILAERVGITDPTIALIVVFLVTLAVSTGFALIGRFLPFSLLFELPRRLWPARSATRTPA